MVEEICRSVDLSEEGGKVNLEVVCNHSLSWTSHFLFWHHVLDYIVSSDNMHGILSKQFIDNGGGGVDVWRNHDSFGSILSLFKFDHIWACSYSLNFKGSLHCSVKLTYLLWWKLKQLWEAWQNSASWWCFRTADKQIIIIFCPSSIYWLFEIIQRISVNNFGLANLWTISLIFTVGMMYARSGWTQ